MKDLFIAVGEVTDKDVAMKSSISAALQRNKVYKDDTDETAKASFRNAWEELIRKEATNYETTSEISDDAHCDAIARIADALSHNHGLCLVGSRLRFGTSQKAFNSYLKCLWKLGVIPMPPHCPIDGVVLRKIGLEDHWTKSDSRDQYMGWIKAIRQRLTLAEWENTTWLQWRLISSADK